MALDHWLLVIHIASASIWLGAGATMSLMAIRARREGTLYPLAQHMEWIGPRLGPVVTVGVVGTGVWMVIRSDLYQFSDGWLMLAIAGLLILLGIGAGYHNRQYKRIAAAAGLHGADSHEVGQLIAGSVRAAQIEVGLLLFVMWVMVFKPGA